MESVNQCGCCVTHEPQISPRQQQEHGGTQGPQQQQCPTTMDRVHELTLPTLSFPILDMLKYNYTTKYTPGNNTTIIVQRAFTTDTERTNL